MNKHAVIGAVGTLLLFGSAAAFAGETKFQIAPRVGASRIHVTDSYTMDHVDEQLDSLALGATFAVVTPVGVTFEGGGYLHSNYSLHSGSNFYVSGGTIAIGYQFETKNGLLFTPKIGQNYWRFTEKEEEFAHPGPEAEITEHGDHSFWELSLQKRLGRVFALGVDLQGGSTDVGSVRSISVIGTFEF